MRVVLTQLLYLMIFVHLGFIYSIVKKRNDIADVFWGPGFVLLSVIGFLLNPNLQTGLLAVVVAIWGLRLAFHIGFRFLEKENEDKRYQKLRASWRGSIFLNSWLRVFLLQGGLLFLIAVNIVFVSAFGLGSLAIINFLGVVVWLFGFIFEVIGDWQLKKFISKSENRGRIMKTGLWKYTRHPNYFGEAILWWGVWLISWGTSYFWLGIISPLVITFLLRFVSGVPMAEAELENNKEFLEYKKKTPPLIPNFFLK